MIRDKVVFNNNWQLSNIDVYVCRYVMEDHYARGTWTRGLDSEKNVDLSMFGALTFIDDRDSVWSTIKQ